MLRIASEDDLAQPLPTAAARFTDESQLHQRLVLSLREFVDRPEVHSGIREEQLREWFAETNIPADPQTADGYFDLLIESVLGHATNMGSPRCLGHMTGGVAAPLYPLSALVVGLNQNLVKNEASRSVGLLERQTLAMLHRLVYGGTDAFYRKNLQRNGSTLGVVTTGGTLANLTALWCARNAALPPHGDFAGVEMEGLDAALRHHGYERAVILGSQLAHYSIEKAAGILGLGTRNLLEIPVDARNHIDIEALHEVIDRCRRSRWQIIAIVGVAGTTDCGSIDPLDELAEIAGREGIHLHVDAAWGAPLLFSETNRHRLNGIERADSVTIDGHKQLYLPIGLSMLLFRSPSAARVLEKRARYMLRHDSTDLGKVSIEGSRGGLVLFAHAAFHLIGRTGYRQLIERNLRNAGGLADLIRESDEFELLCQPETNIVVYRHVPPEWQRTAGFGQLTPAHQERLNAHNAALQQAQHEAGRSYVSRTTLSHLPRYAGIPVVALRAVLVNPATADADLAAVLADQSRIAAELVPLAI